MKKIYILILALVGFSVACTDKFEDFNTDSKNPSDVSGDYMFTSAQKELVDQISNTSVNENIWKLIVQYWTETTYIDEANYDIINRNIPEQIYTAYYRLVLNRLKEAETLLKASEITTVNSEAVKKNKFAILELHRIYAFHNLVNIFGDVPYTEALDVENINPKYDDAATICNDLLTRLDAAYANLDKEHGSFGSADIIYKGNVEAWMKFAQSLKLKIAIGLADVSEFDAKGNVEAAVTAGVFTSADDNALFEYQGAQPNTNPLHEDLVLSGRKDFIPANTLVDHMNSLSDPRRDQYFVDKVGGAYIGGKYGFSNSYLNYSHINAKIEEAMFPGILLTFSELQFYLAEAAERGYNVGGTAESFYNAGIAASFTFWGASDVDVYLANPKVAYSTADGTWKEKIGMQAYIATYTRGLVAYNTYRRLDAPTMNEAQEPATEGPVPTRFTYPINEQTLNSNNYENATKAIGGDKLLTKLFWDKQ